LRGSRVREVWRENKGKRGGRERENKTPSSFIVCRVCSESLYRSLSSDGEKSVFAQFPPTSEEEFSVFPGAR